MADERLRFEAYVKDNATGALKHIQGALASIKKTPGMNEATKWVGEAQVAFKGFTSVAAEVGGSMGALSVGGLAAGAGIASLAKEMKELSDRTLNMRELARQTGMTVDEINRLHYAFAHFGVAAGDVDNAISHLQSQMPQVRAHLGPLYADLGAYFGKSFLQRFEKETSEEQFLDIWKQLGQFSNRPQLQKQLMEEIFGTGALEPGFKEGADALAKWIEKARKAVPKQSPDLDKAAQQYRDSLNDLNTAIDRFNKEVGPTFLRALAEIADDVRFILVGPKAAEQKALDKKEDDRRKGFQERQKERSDAQASKQRQGGAEDERKALEEEHERRRRAIEQDRLKLQRLGPPDATGDPRFMPMSYGGGGVFRRASLTDTGPGPDATGDPRFMPMSYGGGGVFRRAALTETGPGASLFELGKMIAEGTKSGVLAALREMMSGASSSIPDGGPLNASLGGFGAEWNSRHRIGGGNYGGGFGRGGSTARGGGGGDAGPDDYSIHSSHHHLTDLITAEAKRAGIDSRILEGIRAGESARGSHYDFGDKYDGGAWGPFQFNMGRGRFGWQFKRDTGFDPSDPKTIPAQVRYMANFIKRQLQRDPHYADGGDSSRLHAVWHGYHGRRDADPRWGDAGYVPEQSRFANDASNPFLHPQKHPDMPSIGSNPWRNPENHDRRINADPFHTDKQALLRGARHQLEAKIHVTGPAEKVVIKGSNDVAVRLTRFDTLGHRWTV